MRDDRIDLCGVRHTPGTRRRGFVLLELIVVLVLISIIMGITLIFFANFLPSNRLDATARNISSTIKHARSMAQIYSQRQIVAFDLDARHYGIEGREPRDIPDGIGVKIVDPMSGDIIQGQYNFLFHVTGNIEGGTIVVWNAKKSITIQPDPLVGSVVIK
ncbi:MAG TPA: prepilin-type N-terminal cleavage/methylation domain-containing protein [Thermodesulfovibrionales bacterium]|nr:prepilin-type N-terminal cleavage/methylation domain-containing protein [Thermodesulfovibrionales bacterium]